MAVAGEQSADARLRERIDFMSNILFFIEDLYLAVGQGAITTKSGTKLDMSSSLLWVRNQLAGGVKELMIAKKAGWKVLQNLKSQVIFIYLFLFSALSLSHALSSFFGRSFLERHFLTNLLKESTSSMFF